MEMEILLEILGAEEPAYDREELSDPGVVPLLAELSSGPDPGLATKAIMVASLVSDADALALVRGAAESSDPMMRVAAAASAGNLGAETAVEILEPLLRDDDPGVRYTALDSVPESSTAEFLAVVEDVGENDETDDVRNHAKEVLEEIA